MRGKIFLAALALAVVTMLASTQAFAAKGSCFTVKREGVVAQSLMSQADVQAYVDANYRFFSKIGVDACLDAKNGLHVTAAWLRHALPPSPALEKILTSSKVNGFRPWSLLLALYARVVERHEREEEARNAEYLRDADHDR